MATLILPTLLMMMHLGFHCQCNAAISIIGFVIPTTPPHHYYNNRHNLNRRHHRHRHHFLVFMIDSNHIYHLSNPIQIMLFQIQNLLKGDFN